MITKFFAVLGIEVRVAEEHGKGAVSHSSGEFDIGSALGGGKGSELMAEVVEVVVDNIGAEERLRP